MKPCQLGYNCELMSQININKWGDRNCANKDACQEWALSWGLPYTYSSKENRLTVVFRATRYYWLKETIQRDTWDSLGCNIDGMKFGFTSPASERMISDSGDDELDIEEIIIRELTEAGWQEAVPLSKQPKISRDGLIAVKPTITRMIGRLRNLIINKLRKQ